MKEIELKFLIPKAKLKELVRQTKIKSSQEIPMSAHYYDTADQQLANAGIGLRIRKEGDSWVQTIKAGGDGIATRLEHNELLDNDLVQVMLDADTLMPDLTLYEDTSIAPILAHFKLKKLTKNLSRRYITDVKRTTRLVVNTSDDTDKNSSENKVEVAYDYGQIIHGNDKNQCQPIQEIEFELVSGELEFLFTTAKTWCKRHKLYLSTVTKAERGGLLIKNEAHSPAVSANLCQLTMDQDISRSNFVRVTVHNCLLQILPNSSAIVAGSQDNEHTIQLHIGISRLYVALQAFKKFSDQINPEWQPILQQTATLLNDFSERLHLVDHVQPKLVRQGAPNVDWTTDLKPIKIAPIDAIQANDFQLTLIELIEFTMSDSSSESQGDKLAIDKLSRILSKHHAQVLGSDSNQLDDNSQHQWYQQLTNLRYLNEFAAPLYSKKESKRWLKHLTKAQKTLGQYSDTIKYQQYYQHKSITNNNALYGVGWFAAKLKNKRKRYQKQLTRIQNDKIFW